MVNRINRISVFSYVPTCIQIKLQLEMKKKKNTVKERQLVHKNKTEIMKNENHEWTHLVRLI